MNSRLDFETQLILYCLDQRFRETQPNLLSEIPLDKVNWDRLLKIASRNRVIYSFCREALETNLVPATHSALASQIVADGQVMRDNLYRTLDFIAVNLEEVKDKFLLVKTVEPIPHVTWDVDLLVKDRETASLIAVKLGRSGSEVYPDDQAGLKWHCLTDGLLNIEFGTYMSWGNMKYLDTNYLWKDPATVEFEGNQFMIPRPTNSMAILMAHSIFDCQYVTFKDFYQMVRLAEMDMEWGVIAQQADRLGWTDAFERMISVLGALSSAVYGHSVFPVSQYGKRWGWRSVKFPYWVPVVSVVQAYYKKLLSEDSLNRNNLWGTFFFLLLFTYKRLRSVLPGGLYFVHAGLYLPRPLFKRKQ